ncbi:DUF779 domain-containing protein [Paracoccus xiamenensis]|uniref:DUF779 domain-containing protein n=1 Tax=Paracoccus xiamenensis TaxID=2714901 RepID=UPI001A994521|nr:DUF779 domain-containing protein [Paracoccus xiamenensis]
MAREQDEMKLDATQAALDLLRDIQSVHGPRLLFHQSGGCCDGSAPMLFAEGDYRIGDSDVKIGEIGGVPFYMNADQYERWKHTNLLIDAGAGRGGTFSLDNGTGRRFLTCSDVCTR